MYYIYYFIGEICKTQCVQHVNITRNLHFMYHMYDFCAKHTGLQVYLKSLTFKTRF